MDDLHQLKEHYGMPLSFLSIATKALAAQVRVTTWEAHLSGGLCAHSLRGSLMSNYDALIMSSAKLAGLLA